MHVQVNFLLSSLLDIMYEVWAIEYVLFSTILGFTSRTIKVFVFLPRLLYQSKPGCSFWLLPSDYLLLFIGWKLKSSFLIGWSKQTLLLIPGFKYKSNFSLGYYKCGWLRQAGYGNVEIRQEIHNLDLTWQNSTITIRNLSKWKKMTDTWYGVEIYFIVFCLNFDISTLMVYIFVIPIVDFRLVKWFLSL